MIQIPDLSTECIFKAVRSSGKGGQHVNKVSTKVELYFSVPDSSILSSDQKRIVMTKIGHQLNDTGVLRITAENSRSQLKNKEAALDKLHFLITKALTPVKRRIKTKTPVSVKEKRIRDKKVKSDIKTNRKRPGLSD